MGEIEFTNEQLKGEIRYLRDRAETWERLALRIAPVCRNCIHAGALSYSGNYPYDNAWGSCQNGAPIASPLVSDVAQHTSANTARWPAVHHSDTCGSFKLRPLPAEDMEQCNNIRVTWSWQGKPDA